MAFLFSSCFEESKLLVKAEFQTSIENDNYTAPVKVEITNNSTGADFYLWTFEGAEPASSKEKDPGTIVYSKAGKYLIKLEAWNDHERDEKEFTIDIAPSVNLDFDFEILVNGIAPAEVAITNMTEGGVSYKWTFEGGEPESSSEQHPKPVKFNTGGEHKITLVANNGYENFSLTKTLELKEPMAVDFEIIPSFDDFDYEIPFVAQLKNNTTNGVSYKWESSEGQIENSESENTSITITKAGTHVVTLSASNGKETKQIKKEITVKNNTNLYTLQNVKLGIKGAENTIGCYYSLASRSTILVKDVSESNGKDINLAFFALDASFSRCYFTSPTDVNSSGFPRIPYATKTFFVNQIEDTALNFTDKDFMEMQDDSKLTSLDIKGAYNITSWFTNIFIPRIVLFETETGIKGAIRIKAFVSEGNMSYILSDIKVQKKNPAE